MLYKKIVLLIDILCLYFVGLLVFKLYVDVNHNYFQYLLVIFFSIALYVFMFLTSHNMTCLNSKISCYYQLLMTWSGIIATVIFLFFIFKIGHQFSRIWLLSWFISSYVLLVLTRLSSFYIICWLDKKNIYTKRIIIIDTNELGQLLFKRIEKDTKCSGAKVVGFFDENAHMHTLEDKPIIKDFKTLVEYIPQQHVSEVWIATQTLEQDFLENLFHHLRHTPVALRFVPNIFMFRLINHHISQRYGLPVLTLTESPMHSRANLLLKDIEDKALASLILLLISPVMLFLAIGVKLSSPGPIFYRQERVGWNNQPFTMLKFRSMPVNVEQQTGLVWGKATNKKITRFGQFIRKTSLDELPQFINVLKGDMSIVGPRPERTVFVEQFKDEIPDYMQKHMVKAGITGWAQVNGWRGDTDLTKRVEHDMYYIEHWSVLFDLKIILMTIINGFLDKNAK